MVWYMPIVIYFARITDVSIGTVRIILVIRGRKYLAALLGLMESIIWVLAVSQVIIHIKEGVIPLIAYGAGFATGTLVGIVIEQRIALGEQIIRAVNSDPSVHLTDFLRSEGHMVTQVSAEGAIGPVEMAFLVAPRRKVRKLTRTILENCPSAFITVEDVRTASNALSRVPRSEAPGWVRLIKFK